MNIPYGPILVVEDNPNVLELLDGAVRFKGYPVVTAHNGQEEDSLLTIAEILTQGAPPAAHPLIDEHSFLSGYCERLESKLHHKSAQIGRIERLLQTLPAEQQPVFIPC
jgi:hypothetical protein